MSCQAVPNGKAIDQFYHTGLHLKFLRRQSLAVVNSMLLMLLSYVQNLQITGYPY